MNKNVTIKRILPLFGNTLKIYFESRSIISIGDVLNGWYKVVSFLQGEDAPFTLCVVKLTVKPFVGMSFMGENGTLYIAASIEGGGNILAQTNKGFVTVVGFKEDALQAIYKPLPTQRPKDVGVVANSRRSYDHHVNIHLFEDEKGKWLKDITDFTGRFFDRIDMAEDAAQLGGDFLKIISSRVKKTAAFFISPLKQKTPNKTVSIVDICFSLNQKCTEITYKREGDAAIGEGDYLNEWYKVIAAPQIRNSHLDYCKVEPVIYPYKGLRFFRVDLNFDEEVDVAYEPCEVTGVEDEFIYIRYDSEQIADDYISIEYFLDKSRRCVFIPIFGKAIELLGTIEKIHKLQSDYKANQSILLDRLKSSCALPIQSFNFEQKKITLDAEGEYLTLSFSCFLRLVNQYGTVTLENLKDE